MNKFLSFSTEVRSRAFKDDETNFANFTQICVDTALGKPKQFGSVTEASENIVSVFHKALGTDSTTPRNEVRKAIRRNQSLIFDLIEETVQSLLVTGWQNDPFMMKYVDTRNLALGDRNEFYTPDDSMLSVMEVSGNHHDIIRQRLGAGTTTSVKTSWVAIKIYSEFERLMTGADEWSTFVQAVYKAYDNYLKQTIYDTMVGYRNSIASTYKKTGDITATNLRELCEIIEKVTGMNVVIMGTRTALRKVIALQNSTFVSDAMKNEHYTTGMLGMWEGYELVEIPQFFKKNQVGTDAIDNDLLWVMPVADNRFIKVVNEGDTQLAQVVDSGTNMDMTYTYEMQQKIGCAIMFNLAFGMYDMAAS